MCIGPHYALNRCMGTQTILVDRCLWGDDLEFVTVGWLKKNGGMHYPTNAPGDRPKPELMKWKQASEKKLVLVDYEKSPNDFAGIDGSYRFHPALGIEQPDLIEQLDNHDIAIGYRTSALFTAAIRGLPVISFDERSSVYTISSNSIGDIIRPDRTQWLNNMSYAQWSFSEVQSGEALEYVINNRPN